MTSHPIETAKPPGTQVVLERKYPRSHKVSYSLLNDPKIFNFISVSLQDTTVNTHTNLTSNHSGWNLLMCQLIANLKSSRSRSCLYVNKKNDTVIQPIHSPSRDLLTCIVKLESFKMLLINVYNQPKIFFFGLETIDLML